VRRDRERLRDILDAIRRIEARVRRRREALDDELVQVWVLHHLQIIGEASRSLSEEVKALDLEIPWSKIIAMRHILVHDYFDVDVDEVWAAVERDLPVLGQKIEAIARGLPGP